MKYDVIVDACPFCGDDSEGKRRITLNDGDRKLYYYECSDCNLVYMSPRPTQEALAEFYEGDEYHNTRIGMKDTHALSADELGRARRIIQEIKEGKTLLDIGCAKGHLLFLAVLKGYQVMGVEPKLEYVQAGIPAVATPDEIERQFDVVTCIHTLEHTLDFQGLAEHIKRLVKPGGQVIIEIPSAQSPGVLNNAHLYFFNPTVLKNVFDPLELEHMKFTPHLHMKFRKIIHA